jgi:hypothetical protein
VVVIMVILTTPVVPPVVRLLYAGEPETAAEELSIAGPACC